MALTYTSRFGLIQWGAGTDAYTRAEANAALETINELGAIDVTVADAAHLPAPAITGRYIWQTDEQILWRDDGANLRPVRLMATVAPAASDPAVAGTPGVDEAAAHADHGHTMPPWGAAPGDFDNAVAFGQPASAGTNDVIPRAGHKHPLPTHTKADHDALHIDADTLDGLNSTDFDLAPPAGEVRMFAGAVPPGWLNCDGSTVARAAFPNLFAAIGTTWGNGDGSGTTFSLPDLRGRAPIGAGTGPGLSARAVGDRSGAETHAVAVGEMPGHTHDTDTTHGHVQAAHNHAITDPGHNHGSAGHVHGVGGVGHGPDFVTDGTGPHGLTQTNVTAFTEFQSFTASQVDANVGGATGESTQNSTPAIINGGGVATSASVGGGAAMSLMQPFGVVTFAVKT